MPELRGTVDATPSGHLTYHVTEWGKPFAANGFGNWFRDRCDEAGLPQCSAHGMRKRDAIAAAENGATDRQLMTMFGWKSAQQATTYTKAADTNRMAEDAMHLILPIQKGNKAVTPTTESTGGVTKTAKKP